MQCFIQQFFEADQFDLEQTELCEPCCSTQMKIPTAQYLRAHFLLQRVYNMLFSKIVWNTFIFSKMLS